MSRVYNFGAGPAMLPQAVLEQVKDELLNWNDTGISIMEMPHRGADFKAIALEAEQDLRDLLSIPDNYRVLFLHGGGRSQFAMVPMNLAKGYPCMAYLNTGAWSNFALKEAERYGDVRVVASGESQNFTSIPDPAMWDMPQDAAYFHYTDNETIQGVEFKAPPESQGLPLVTDMSSNLLSKQLDISQYGLIYACAQKNLGPPGTTIVIIRDDLLAREPMDFTPSMMRYSIHAKQGSLYNTPSTFSWYVCGLVFKWLKAQGGIEKIQHQNELKAACLYNYIDSTDFYVNPVDPSVRSNMNVVYTLHDESLNEKFLAEAARAGLANLKGHRSVGGMRASIYNSMPLQGVEALVDFMADFAKQH